MNDSPLIKVETPPNFRAIVTAFPHAARPGVLFAYGEHIYNPSGVHIPRVLMVHEVKHLARQFQASDAWWDRYIADPEFRYSEELIAHAAELRAGLRATKDRNARYRLLRTTAWRLIADLYNYDPPRLYKQAMADLSANV